MGMIVPFILFASVLQMILQKTVLSRTMSVIFGTIFPLLAMIGLICVSDMYPREEWEGPNQALEEFAMVVILFSPAVLLVSFLVAWMMARPEKDVDPK
jgi:cation transporter-like permease